MRILVIEDDKDLCSVIGYHLEREGYTAGFCHDNGLKRHWGPDYRP